MILVQSFDTVLQHVVQILENDASISILLRLVSA
jgi:hypothetical protein